MKTRKQAGATAVEFALSLLLFLTFVLGIVDFSRMLFTWQAANEATRLGARYAAVCDSKYNKDDVLAKMQAILPQLKDSNLVLEWSPNLCTHESCQGVTVSIEELDYQWISPIAGVAAIAPIPMPSFSTFLPRERMRQDPRSEEFCT